MYSFVFSTVLEQQKKKGLKTNEIKRVAEVIQRFDKFMRQANPFAASYGRITRTEENITMFLFHGTEFTAILKLSLRINTWKLNVFVLKDESYINIKNVFELLRAHKVP
jgi:cobalamin biosynthesis Co2+ chelatase CbiK